MKKLNVREMVDEEVKWNYPCLGKSHTGRIVLFKSDGVGTVLSSKDMPGDVGNYSLMWDMECFTPIDGPVILEMK